MTTRISIVNHGPEAVDVIVAQSSGSIEDHHIARSTIVASGAHMEEYVYHSQYIVVRERKRYAEPKP